MRKRKKAPVLGSNSRIKSAKLNLTKSLFQYGKIKTSLPRAKQASVLADRLINRCKTPGLGTLRFLEKKTGNFNLARTVYQYGEVATKKRKSGFCSVRRVGFRKGDNAMQATITLVDFAPKEKKAKKQQKADKQQKSKKTDPTPSQRDAGTTLGVNKKNNA